jgi:hypothetical protein
MNLILENASRELTEYIQSHSADILKSTSVTGVDFQYDDTGEGRWNQLVLASQGARLWTDRTNKNSPLYAGPLPTDYRGVEMMIADLSYTQQQLDFYKSFGVVYIGRVEVDPRNILVIDHKKTKERHDVHLSEPLGAFLSALPADWWGSLGIVSAGSVDKLQAFLEAIPDAVPLVYTPGAAAKLRFFGLDFVELEEPKRLETGKPDLKYGRNVRGLTNSLFLQPKK